MTVHKERQLDFMTLQAWKMKFFDFMTFQFSLTCTNPVDILA